MEALILNRKFQTQCIIDAFESFIWTERYNTPGDFELYIPMEKTPLEYLKRDYYIWIKDSDRLQIIEDLEIDTSVEDGDYITVTGRTLESILDRRVIFAKTVINGNLQNGIKKLLNENAIQPIDPNRKIPNLRFVASSDSRITSLTMNAIYLGEGLLDIIQTECQANDLGFKIIYNESLGTFDFSLYFGEDRSYAQEKNPWVVFSSAYDNLLGSNYYESYAGLKTAAVIASDDDDELGQEIVDVDGRPEMVGLDRREMFVDGYDIDRVDVKVDEDAIRERIEKRYSNKSEAIREQMIEREIASATQQAQMNAAETLRAQLKQKGKDELAKTYITETFEGEIVGAIQYIFGRDFFIGDVVQVRNRYGKEASSRVTEVVRSHDVNGVALNPTFTTLIGGSNKGDITNPDL